MRGGFMEDAIPAQVWDNWHRFAHAHFGGQLWLDSNETMEGTSPSGSEIAALGYIVLDQTISMRLRSYVCSSMMLPMSVAGHPKGNLMIGFQSPMDL